MLPSLRDNTTRARQARLFFSLFMGVSGVLLGLSLLLPGTDWALVETGDAPTLTLVLTTSYGLLTLASVGLNVANYVVLIRWLRRAYYNLWQLPGIARPSYSDGWAAGAWFVPFINLARPYTIMREVWEGTQRAALGQTILDNSLLSWWWGAHLVALVVGRITFSMSSSGSGISSRDIGLFTLDTVFGLLAAWLTWRVIGQVATFEEMLTARQQVAELGQPAPPPALPPGGQSDYALEGGY